MISNKSKFKPISKNGFENTKLANTLRWRAYLILFVFGFILYGNTLTHSYCLDDEVVITDNQFTQEGFRGIGKIFEYDTFTGWYLVLQKGMHISPEAAQKANNILSGGRYRPFSVATFAIEIALFGQKPGISHFINIILYILTCIVLYRVLLKLIPPKEEQKWYFSVAFICTLLFMAHPLHTEVVANIKGRDEIFALLGSVSALWFTLQYLSTRKNIHLLWIFLCFTAGLFSKENTITFVALIPLTAYYFTPSKGKPIAIAVTPIILSTLLFLTVRSRVLGEFLSSNQMAFLLNNPFLEATTAEKFATIFFTFLKYLQLLIFPHPLTWDYYPYHIPIIGWADWRAIVPAVLYMAMGIYALIGLKKRSIPSYCIWAYLIPLSIVSNIFFPVGVFMSERFIYMSSIGFCIFLAWILVDVLPRYIHKKQIILIVTGLILVLYSVKTITRNTAWKDSRTLYNTDIKVSKNSIKSNYNIGCGIIKQITEKGLVENSPEYNKCCRNAIHYIEKVVDIAPNYYEAHYFLGLAWDAYGHQTVKSLEQYKEALQYHNENLHQTEAEIIQSIKITTNYALDLIGNPNYKIENQSLINIIDSILQLKPDIPSLLHLKGVVYGIKLNNYQQAIYYMEQAANSGYGDIRFFRHLSTAYYLNHDYQNTLRCYNKILELSPNDVQTLFSMAHVYKNLGNEKSANEYFKLAKNAEQQKATSNN